MANEECENMNRLVKHGLYACGHRALYDHGKILGTRPGTFFVYVFCSRLDNLNVFFRLPKENIAT